MADEPQAKPEEPKKDKTVVVKCAKYPSLEAVVGDVVVKFRGGVAEVTPEQAKELLKREWISK